MFRKLLPLTLGARPSSDVQRRSPNQPAIIGGPGGSGDCYQLKNHVANTAAPRLRSGSSMPLQQLTWLILKDGTSYLARDYWIEAGKLQCVTLDWERKLLPLGGWT